MRQKKSIKRKNFWTWKISFLRVLDFIVLSFLVLRYTSNTSPDGSFNILKNTFLCVSFSCFSSTILASCLSSSKFMSNCFGQQFQRQVVDWNLKHTLPPSQGVSIQNKIHARVIKYYKNYNDLGSFVYVCWHINM